MTKSNIETAANGLASTEEQVGRYLQLPYARVILPETDGTYRGEIIEFPGCISSGDTAAEALSQLEEVAKSWLCAAIENDQSVPPPVETNSGYSGKLVLRIPKSLHKKASWVAEREGVSLNQFISTSLAEALGERQVPRNIYLSFYQPSDFKQHRSLQAPLVSVTNWHQLGHIQELQTVKNYA